MTAASSSLMRETSTTLRRSSEVRDRDSPCPPKAWTVCLYSEPCERCCWMCYAVFLWWQPQYRCAQNFKQSCICQGEWCMWVWMHAHVFIAVCACSYILCVEVEADAENQLWFCFYWKTTHLKRRILNKSLEMPLWVNLLLLALPQEVELMSHSSLSGGSHLWGEAMPNIVHRIWVYWKLL